jgi:homoserine kinase
MEGVLLSGLPVAPKLKILLTVPEFHLETQKARAAIPRTAGPAATRSSIFSEARLRWQALLRNEFHFLRESLRDKLHQPFPGSADSWV